MDVLRPFGFFELFVITVKAELIQRYLAAHRVPAGPEVQVILADGGAVDGSVVVAELRFALAIRIIPVGDGRNIRHGDRDGIFPVKIELIADFFAILEDGGELRGPVREKTVYIIFDRMTISIDRFFRAVPQERTAVLSIVFSSGAAAGEHIFALLPGGEAQRQSVVFRTLHRQGVILLQGANGLRRDRHRHGCNVHIERITDNIDTPGLVRRAHAGDSVVLRGRQMAIDYRAHRGCGSRCVRGDGEVFIIFTIYADVIGILGFAGSGELLAFAVDPFRLDGEPFREEGVDRHILARHHKAFAVIDCGAVTFKVVDIQIHKHEALAGLGLQIHEIVLTRLCDRLAVLVQDGDGAAAVRDAIRDGEVHIVGFQFLDHAGNGNAMFIIFPHREGIGLPAGQHDPGDEIFIVYVVIVLADHIRPVIDD